MKTFKEVVTTNSFLRDLTKATKILFHFVLYYFHTTLRLNLMRMSLVPFRARFKDMVPV